MSYTNVHIPDRFNTQTQLREKVHELKSKIDWLNQMLDSYEKELQNIPKAILEYGFVELNYENKKMKVGQIP